MTERVSAFPLIWATSALEPQTITVPSSTSAAVFDKVLLELSRAAAFLDCRHAAFQKLARLRSGWNGYSAPAPDPIAIRTAELCVHVAKQQGMEPHRIEASVMGGVGVTFRRGNRKVYVEFYNDGTAHALLSENASRMETMPLHAEAEAFQHFVAKAKDYLNA